MRKTIWTAAVLGLACALSVACMGKDIQRFGKAKKKVDRHSDCATKLPVGKTAPLAADKTVTVCVYSPKKEPTSKEIDALKSAAFAYGVGYVSQEMKISGKLKAEEITTTPETSKKAGKKSPSTPSKKTGKLGASLSVLLVLPEGITPEKAKAVKAYVENSCMEDRILPAWERASPSVKLDIDFLLEDEVGRKGWDQELNFISIQNKDEREKAHPHYTLEMWPFHSDLFPSGTATCMEDCLEKAGRSSQAQKHQCGIDCANEKSEPFCQSLAKLAAHWLGAKDPIAETNCQPTEKDLATLAKSRSLTRGYMRADDRQAEPAATDKDSDQVKKDDTEKGEAANKTIEADDNDKVGQNSTQTVPPSEEFWQKATVDMKTGIDDVLDAACKVK